MENFDVIVIGAGPAGYVSAIRCTQLGLNTALIDDWLNEENQPSLGGTCLNVGCIPSKALLESSELYEHASHELGKHGIKHNGVSLDLTAMLQRKQQVVKDLTSGIGALVNANGISLFTGQGKLLVNKEVEVILAASKEKQRIKAKNIILAPGSVPRAFPATPFKKGLIVDSSEALAFKNAPKSLAVIGAGVIGLELGSVWRRLGAEVSLFKSSATMLPAADEHIGKQAHKLLAKQGLDFKFGSKITDCKIKSKTVSLTYEDKGGSHTADFDKIIVAVGREPNTKNVFSKESGLKLDDKGRIEVDDQCRTTLADVYAIGDAVRGPMLAHKGSEEGVMVADLIAGQHARVNYETVPFVIYTDPEIAWCGKPEHELKKQGIKYNSGMFSFAANGRARASGSTDGLIKVLADAKTDRVLGVHMIGPHVSELIGQAVIAMEFSTSSEDLAMTMFAHPSLSEVFHEASLDVNNKALHKAHAGKARK